ncbi:MAG: hypothetical protein WCB44_03680, partial [Stellaceae bacterium]
SAIALTPQVGVLPSWRIRAGTCLLNFAAPAIVPRQKMFEDFGKPNLATLLTLGLVSAVLPKLLPQMGPAVGTAAKIVIDLLTESEAEAAEELIDALVSSTIAEINKEVARPGDPQQSRQAVERTVEHFKHRARRRAHTWGTDEHDRKRRYRRHLAKLRAAVDRATHQHADWRRDVLDDVGESLDEVA